MRLVEESRSYIEAVAAEVDAIHRSRALRELPGDGIPTLPVQVFVCGIKREERYQIFVALHSKSCKRTLVYSLALEQKGKSGYETAVQWALDACQALGFAMESVNLKCSTALREVMIRDVPVLLSPAAARKASSKRAEELAGLERLTMQQEENEMTAEAATGLSPARRAALESARQERQEAVKEAARRLAAESVADAREAATRQAVERLLAPGFEVVRPGSVSALDSELRAKNDQRAAEVAETARLAAARVEAERAERERLAAAKVLAEQRAAEAAETARLAAARAEAERAERERLAAAKVLAEQRAAERVEAVRAIDLQAAAFRQEQERQAAAQARRERVERERLAAEKAAAEQRTAELDEAVRATENRVEIELQKRERLLAEKNVVDNRAAELAEAARQAELRVEAERIEQQRLLAAKSAVEQQTAELAEAVRAVELQAGEFRKGQEREAVTQDKREQAERKRLAAEQAVAEQRAAERVEVVKEAARLAEAERVVREPPMAKSTAAKQRPVEMDEAVQRAERQAAADRAEREQLLIEKRAVEQRVAELTSAARRAAEMAEIARQAVALAEAERSKRERLQVDKKRVERRLLEQAEWPRQGEPVRAETGRRREALPSLGGLFASAGKELAPPPTVAPLAKSSSRPAVSGAFFQVDWDLAEIVYDTSADVLEVQQSVNMTQLSLEGFPNQYCTAYIVALKKRTGRQVHVAFRLATSDRVLVYSPPKPPHDQETYAKAMQEAERFLRVTGIETERLPLGKSPQSRSRALSQIPVLRRRPRTPRNS